MGSTARLARYGFSARDRAVAVLGESGLGLWHQAEGRPVDRVAGEVLEMLGAAPDPDLAVHQLQRLAEVAPDVVDAVRDNPGLRSRLIAVLGASAALGDHLVAHPAEWQVLAEPLDAAPGEVLDAAMPHGGTHDATSAASHADVVETLRIGYRRVLLRLAAADLTGARDTEDVMAALSDLADATLGEALRIATTELGGDQCRLAVIAMGKCGGRELNYVSDVDVIFVAEPVDGVVDTDALRQATALASRMMEICRRVAWPVDAALRPEGKDGPLVRTLASHLAYYRRWARTWEFQALLKARPAAGDAELGQRWWEAVHPLVWQAADRPDVVEDVRAMRRRVESQLPPRYAQREIKLGRGGLRDIEFAVQLLQLVHGRADERLRSRRTLDALRALTAGGYVGRADGEQLADSYRWLRTVEHRLQLQRLRRTHRVPEEPAALRWLAQALGYRADARRDAVAAFNADWSAHAARVRRLHEKLLYRPVLEAVAKVPTDGLRLNAASASRRLEVLGFADPAGALRHIEALTSGVSRAAAIQRTLLPVLLSEFADAPEPDRGLLGYRTVSEALGSTPWYLRLLRDEGPVALRLARLLALSKYLTELLSRDPEALRLLADNAELTPRPAPVLMEGMAAAARRHDDPAAAVRAVRALRRRELFRIAAADLFELVDVRAVGQALAEVTDAVLGAALRVAFRAVCGEGPYPVRLAVIGMGRLGGLETSYPSDADVMFVHEAEPGVDETTASQTARQVAEKVRALLGAPAPDPPLGVDAGLRPEGRDGPLTRSLAAYQHYYQRWAGTWEAQALLRARFVCGDVALGERFIEVADQVRYPDGGLTDQQVTEIRRIKARVEHERLPRGADPATHTKLGRGGLADVEWTVQLWQLRFGHQRPALRTTRTLDALDAARSGGLLSDKDAAALSEAWLLATRVRNAVMLVRGRPSDQVPRRGPEVAGVARVLGWPAGSDPEEFVDHYLRTARRARRVVERVFYGPAD